MLMFSCCFRKSVVPLTSEVTQKIRTAAEGNEKGIYLKSLNLNYLPKVIVLLTHLTVLDLSKNKLSFLLTEIGKLTNLEGLFLDENELSALPREIGQLTRLTCLTLNNNQLRSLPTEIGLLTRLTCFTLSFNQLRTLPTEIGLLTSLTKLVLNDNQFNSLPQELGNLTDINLLYLVNNSTLSELPLNLGQIPQLTHIFNEGTGIDSGFVRAILNQCRSMRDREAVQILPARLSKWKAIAKSEANLDVNELSDEQKKTLNEWLLRLEKTKEFAKAESRLARTVCSIVADVIANREFQELFFPQAEVNNACCEDRAAMALNEIYTSWMILCQSGDLGVMTGAAKTLCLRKELQKLIGEERESVEIFLYYESTLSKRLKLVTAIEHMTYDTIGKREWIDEALVKTVNDHFFDHLFAIPVFQKRAKEALQKEWNRIKEEAEKELTDCPPGDEFSEVVLTWSHKQGEVLQKMNSAWAECVKKWYEATYVSH